MTQKSCAVGMRNAILRNYLKFPIVKAEAHDATNRCDTSPRQVAATNSLVWHVKIIVAATEVCRCDLSHKFKLVWIRATYRSDKLSASDLSLSHRVSRPRRLAYEWTDIEFFPSRNAIPVRTPPVGEGRPDTRERRKSSLQSGAETNNRFHCK